MKDIFVEEFKVGQKIQKNILFVSGVTEAKTKAGKDYLNLTLSDKTGSIKAKVWDDALQNCDTISNSAVVYVSGEVAEYKGELQFTIKEMKLEQNYNEADFVKTSTNDLNWQFEMLLQIIYKVENLFLKELLVMLFEKDEQIGSAFKKATAAERAHHAYLGGLLEHVLEMFNLSKEVCNVYPEVNRDLLTTGIILHDIGKIQELSVGLSFERTLPGNLLGHIVQGVLLVEKKINLIKDFPQDLKDIVLHLIVSHHGELEFGSPVKPIIIEAFVLNLIDNFSAKLNMLRELKKTVDNKGFSGHSHLLGGKFYFEDKVDEKLKNEQITSLQIKQNNQNQNIKQEETKQVDDSNLQIPF